MFSIFGEAAPDVQLVLILLVSAAISAVVLGGLNWTRSRGATGRSPIGLGYLAGLRLTAPLLALAFVARNGMVIFQGVADSPSPPGFAVLAPGLAEISLLLFLGLFASAAAVLGHAVGRASRVIEPHA